MSGCFLKIDTGFIHNVLLCFEQIESVCTHYCFLKITHQKQKALAARLSCSKAFLSFILRGENQDWLDF